MATILIVDDEDGVRFSLAEIAKELGHAVIEARATDEAIARFDTEIDVVVTDWLMPGRDGLALLAEIRRVDAGLPVILLTARGDERLAVRAMKEGAFDYLPKPFALEEIEHAITRAVALGESRREVRRARARALVHRPFVGKAPSFVRALDLATRFGATDAPVLIRGETGTGKELCATLVHATSPRARGPLVRFNCAAVAEDLAESELFGHVKGAFTGATGAHRGFFSQAHGGTLVLDEVGELSPRLQPKLLRALQAGEIQRVGAAAVEHVDVRIVASTHRDLLASTRDGRFREDLYYRLAVLEITMPPLRERREDVPLLAEHFAREAAHRFGIEGVVLRPALLDALGRLPFPGNVRELENLMTRMVALTDDGVLDADDRLDGNDARAPVPRGGGFRAQVEDLERKLLEGALQAAGGNQSEAARRLELSRATFLDKLKRHGIG